jgi:hypothetical protein
MKKLILSIIASGILTADHYMAQIEPYQTHSVEAEVSGVIHRVALQKEFSYVQKGTLIVGIESSDEQIAISSLKSRIAILEDILKLKRENLASKKRVRQISKYEINNETLSVLDTKSALESLKMELKLKQNIIDKKRFYLSDGYLGQIYVDEFEYVSPNEKIFDYYDFRKSRLDIFVGADEVQIIRDKTILINGAESEEWRVEKVSKVKDSQRISTYRVRLVKENRTPKDAQFGEVVKVEFK